MKNFIQENCMTKTGRIGFNNRCHNSIWWENKNFHNQLNKIVSLTSFLKDASSTVPQRCWHILNDIYITPTCKNNKCNENTNFKSFSKGYYNYCSKKCSSQCEERNKKIVNNTNHAEMVKNLKRSNLERYDVEYSFQRKDVKNKSKKTKLKKYGDSNYCNFEKAKKTNIKKYGSEFYFSSDIGKGVLEKMRIQNNGSLKLDKATNTLLNDINYLKEMNKNLNIDEIADELNVTRTGLKNILVKNDIELKKHKRKTKLHTQEEIYDYCKHLTDKVVWNDRKAINPKELDIYFPDHSVAIELNGLYWHSYNYIENSEEKMKHYAKYQECKDKGIRLIQLTDRDWSNKKDICKGIIANSVGVCSEKIRASKCVIRKMNTKEAKEFLNDNHIQGYSASSIKLGLYYKETLVYIMTFSKPRFSVKYDYELIRCCSKLNTKVYGAASKILKYFNKNSIISYCDISKFEGKLYESLGFEYSHASKPNYFYFKKDVIIPRYKAQKANLHKILDVFDSNKTEAENMFINNYRRYWDCGNSVFILE